MFVAPPADAVTLVTAIVITVVFVATLTVLARRDRRETAHEREQDAQLAARIDELRQLYGVTVQAGTASTSTAVDTHDTRVGLVVVLLGASVVHLAVIPEHIDEYPPFGLFFIVAASAQLVLAWRCIRRFDVTVATATVALSAGLVLLWLLSRTVGLPVGPQSGRPEPVGLADVLASLYEAAAVLFGVVLLRARCLSTSPARWTARGWVFAAIVGWFTVGAVIQGH